jgi:hypothetical protein
MTGAAMRVAALGLLIAFMVLGSACSAEPKAIIVPFRRNGS